MALTEKKSGGASGRGTFLYLLALLLVAASGALLYAWSLAGGGEETLRPVTTAEALLKSLPGTPPPPVTPKAEPPAPAPEAAPVSAPPKEEAAPAPKAVAKAPPPPARTEAVGVGLFRSQKYLLEMEESLDRLSLPHYRRVSWRKGETFVVLVGGKDAGAVEAAARALSEKGYEFSRAGGSLKVYFHLEEEALPAAGLAKKSGAEAKVKKSIEEAPRWALYAGPFDAEGAKAAMARIEREGIEARAARYEP